MRISISADGKDGFVAYDPHNREALVSHPNGDVCRCVNEYLNTEKDFTVPGPGSNNPMVVGSRSRVSAVPVHHPDYFTLALSEMMTHTGVKVNWNHPDNYGSESDPNGGKESTVKSMSDISLIIEEE